MYNPSDCTKILWEAYDQFLLSLGDKKIPTPYRRNEVGNFQKLGPEFQGKSSPQVLTETTIRLAKKQHFDLNKASTEEIRKFMRQNKLGIDCSGFAYRMLNYLVQKIKGQSLEAFDFPHVGRTNVAKLTSDEFSVPVSNFTETQPGDLIKFNSNEDILHTLVILENKEGIITYAHSSGETVPDGVHTGKIEGNKFPEDLKTFSYDPTKGDGPKRLKILQ